VAVRDGLDGAVVPKRPYKRGVAAPFPSRGPYRTGSLPYNFRTHPTSAFDPAMRWRKCPCPSPKPRLTTRP
jgi:hypothetical protein